MQLSFSILHANGEAGKVYTAEGSVISFGRSDECDVQLDDGYVSGRHAEIQCVDGRFYLQDLKSTNGTWLKEIRIDGRVPLQENTVVEFGKGGPKVRILELQEQNAGAANNSISQPNRIHGQQKASTVGIARDADPHSKSSSKLKLLMSSVAAVFAAVVCGFFLLQAFLPKQDPAANPPANPTPPVVSDAVAASEPNIQENISDIAVIPVPVVDIEKLAESARDQCVWIGLKVMGDGSDSVFPLCSGWCYSDRQIITSGTVVAEFLAAGETLTLVVYSNRLSDAVPYVKVKRTVIHPDFNVSDPQSSASMEHNLGLLELEEPLPKANAQPLHVADSNELKSSLNSAPRTQLTQCGYSISLEGEPLSTLTIPEYSCTSISSETFIPGSSTKILPLIRVSFEKTLSTMRGRLVLNSSGNVVGTLQHIDETNAIMTPVDRIAQLLSSAANSSP